MAAGVSSSPRIVFPLSVFLQHDAQDAALPAGMGLQAKTFADAVQHVCSFLLHAPSGRALLRAAVLRGVHIGLDPLLEPQTSFYYPLQRRLDIGYQPRPLLSSQKGISLYLASIIGGLRRIWQHGRALTPDTRLKPEDFLRYCRAFEADVCAITHLAAWELRAAGPCFFWRHLLAGADGDVSVSFARTAAAHPRHQFDGTALRAAFLEWFEVAERVDACDHLALEMMDMALLGARGAAQDIGRMKLDTARLCQLGVMPQGGNYLGGMRFRAPQMRRRCDPFNRTHLKHIERDICYLSENQESF